MTPTWITPEFTQRLAGSLIHFLWQGAVIAAVTAVCLRLLARKRAEWRYAVSCAALAAMLAAPTLTFVFYAQTGAVALRVLHFENSVLVDTAQTSLGMANTALWTQWIVIVWSLGVAAGSIRMGIGWIATRRLLASQQLEIPASVYQMFEAVGDWMSIQRPVRLLVQAGIHVPSVIGWLRPIVLLPVSAVTRLDELQLRAVLAHEMAHIRRHDFLVNVMQRCLEAILFYHPAVWWLSARIRSEREHCCDDLAVQLCGDRLLYAEALLELERSREAHPAFSVAATGAGLTERVHRILGGRTAGYEWQSVVAVTVTIATWCIVGTFQSTTVQAIPLAPPAKVAVAPMIVQDKTPSRPPLAAALSAITAIVTAQQTIGTQPSSGASIDGIVVKAGTSEGLAGANVELTQLSASTGNSAPPRLIVSGSDGRFAFRDLSEGGYRLVADLPLSDYQPGEYGQKNPRSRGATIRLGSSQKMENMRIEMVLSGAVAGRVTGTHGEAVARARVVAMEMSYRDGQPVLNILQAVQTDDLGQYRLFWLSPGKYYIGTRTEDVTRKTISIEMPAPGRAGTYEEVSSPVIRHMTTSDGVVEETDRMVYYGNTLDPAQAVGIDVTSGKTQEGINVSIAPGIARAFRVRGNVMNSEGSQPAQPVSIRLIPRNWTADTVIPNATTDRQGSFEVLGVVPGSYVLYASASSPSGALSGRISIDVGNANLDRLKLTVTPGVEISGHVTINGDAEKIPLSALRISLVRDPDLLALPQAPTAAGNRGAPTGNAGNAANGGNGTVAADGAFKLPPMGVGDYRLNIAGLPKGAYLQTAQSGLENILAAGIHIDGSAIAPFEIRIGTDPGKIEGSTISERREPFSNAVVVLVPEASLRRQKNLFKQVTSDLLGRFAIEDVPPGVYKLFGWDYVTEGAWENEAFMKTVESRGRTITVIAKSTATLDGLAIPR